MRTYGHKWSRRCCLMTAMLQAFGVLALMVVLRVSEGVRATCARGACASELARADLDEVTSDPDAPLILWERASVRPEILGLETLILEERERWRLAPKTSPPCHA